MAHCFQSAQARIQVTHFAGDSLVCSSELFGGQGMLAAMLQALGCLYEQARALADGDSEAQKAARVIF